MFAGKGWNEQYMMQSFLACNTAFEVLFGTHWMMRRHWDLLRGAFPDLAEEDRHREGTSLWIRRRI